MKIVWEHNHWVREKPSPTPLPSLSGEEKGGVKFEIKSAKLWKPNLIRVIGMRLIKMPTFPIRRFSSSFDHSTSFFFRDKKKVVYAFLKIGHVPVYNSVIAWKSFRVLSYWPLVYVGVFYYIIPSNEHGTRVFSPLFVRRGWPFFFFSFLSSLNLSHNIFLKNLWIIMLCIFIVRVWFGYFPLEKPKPQV